VVCCIFCREDGVRTLEQAVLRRSFFCWRGTNVFILVFVNVFYERWDLIRKLGSLERVLLLLGRMGRGKTGSNVFNWRDVFEYYLKKILSIFYIFNVHYLSLYLDWKCRSAGDQWDLERDFLECIARVSRALYLTSLICRPCNQGYPRPISKKLDERFLRVKHNLIIDVRVSIGWRYEFLIEIYIDLV